ncbi:MAG: heme NO-binding domain-containing protein [Flavobacteriales bacterium]|nr:heme NO-binding domain-containing protein [Flavobacteriales bacterium]
MYGIVNKAIEELVKENFGEDKWQIILEKSGIDAEFFISNEPYDDDITFKLAMTISSEMNMSLRDVLIAFGEWWILKTAKERYGYLLASGGNNFRDFIINLPIFHNRIIMMYPKLSPPEFKVTDIQEQDLKLHYISTRKGLSDFVYGLISGLGKFYQTETNIEYLESKEAPGTYDIFRISWK